MSSIDYHGALSELRVACAKAGDEWAFVENPLQGFAVRSLPSDDLLNKVLWKTGVFLRHLFLWVQLVRFAGHKMILVREFSNWPLLLIAPLLLPLRRKLLLTINHNVQWAVGSRGECFALRMLDRLGFRFLFLETLDGAEYFGLNASRHWTLPHPISVGRKQMSSSAPFTVGIVGHYRPEKGIDAALDVLLENSIPECRLVIGVPNIADFKRPPDDRFELRDTSGREDYFSTLAECDVVLLCYPEDGYRFRASGIIADAASCGTPVLVPRLPVLEHQVSSPAPVGACYSAFDEIPACLERMRNIDYAEALSAYAEGRSADALALRLDKLMEATEA